MRFHNDTSTETEDDLTKWDALGIGRIDYNSFQVVMSDPTCWIFFPPNFLSVP